MGKRWLSTVHELKPIMEICAGRCKSCGVCDAHTTVQPNANLELVLNVQEWPARFHFFGETLLLNCEIINTC